MNTTAVFGVLTTGVLAVLCWFVFHLLRQHGRLLLRLDELERKLTTSAAPSPVLQPAAIGLPLGTPAPAFALSAVGGRQISLASLRQQGKPVLLVFSDPNCGPCTALVPEVARWQLTHADTLRIVVVSRGTPEAHQADYTRHRVRDLLMQVDREVATSYGAHGTPSAVLVQPDGTIGSHVAQGSKAITDLVHRVTDGASATKNPPQVRDVSYSPKPSGSRIGSAAPAIQLPDLNGKDLTLAQFIGTSTVVLLWNPACGFCQRMLDDLRVWERNRPADAPRLLVVSAGTVEANRAMDLQSPVGLDEHFNVGRQLGARGTPSAVLVDSEGKVASELAVGAEAVFQIAGWRLNEPGSFEAAPRALIAEPS